MSQLLRPLRGDSSISDPDLARGARILGHSQPLPKSESRKRRVWNMLSSGGRSRLGFKLTALHVAFASVLVAAASSAAVGHYYVQHLGEQASLGPLDATSPGRPGHARPAAKRPSALAPGPATRLEPAQAELQSNALLAPALHAPAARTKPDAVARRSTVADADAELLVEAMRARRAGDSRRVSQLTDEYRAKHPQGALQEEALILAVESAATRGAPNTGALAREYLAHYPSGRFALQAKRALGEGAR